jgi:hypothetical protein
MNRITKLTINKPKKIIVTVLRIYIRDLPKKPKI